MPWHDARIAYVAFVVLQAHHLQRQGRGDFGGLVGPSHPPHRVVTLEKLAHSSCSCSCSVPHLVAGKYPHYAAALETQQGSTPARTRTFRCHVHKDVTVVMFSTLTFSVNLTVNLLTDIIFQSRPLSLLYVHY